MWPRSAKTCKSVDATPFVVENETESVSSCHGLPAASRVPPQMSTTFSPRWYTHTDAPPGPRRGRIRDSETPTGAKSGCSEPCSIR